MPSLLTLGLSEQALRSDEIPAALQVKQGEVAYLILKPELGTDAVKGRFLNQPIPFFRASGDDFAALIGIDLAQAPGPQPLEVTWKNGQGNGSRTILIEVLEATFGTQNLTLPKEMVDLDPPTLVRVEKEQ
ncbi:MAG TPA: hypothetical protein VI382_04650, partial [Candidatus Manganitrophaceae bacterium]|nr:hypothetical protein [Candidatus Manganitrophaceae bacterium]